MLRPVGLRVAVPLPEPPLHHLLLAADLLDQPRQPLLELAALRVGERSVPGLLEQGAQPAQVRTGLSVEVSRDGCQTLPRPAQGATLESDPTELRQRPGCALQREKTMSQHVLDAVRVGFPLILDELSNAAGRHQEPGHNPRSPGRWFRDVAEESGMGQPQRRADQGAAGMAPVVEEIGKEHPDQRRQDQEDGHLATEESAGAPPRPPAGDGAEPHQSQDHHRAAPRMDHPIRADPVANQGGDQVPARTGQAVDQDELRAAVPGLDEGAQLVHRQQVEPEVDQTVMDEIAGHEPPDFTLGQALEGQVAEVMAVAEAGEQPAEPGQGVARGAIGVGHGREDHDPDQAEGHGRREIAALADQEASESLSPRVLGSLSRRHGGIPLFTWGQHSRSCQATRSGGCRAGSSLRDWSFANRPPRLLK